MQRTRVRHLRSAFAPWTVLLGVFLPGPLGRAEVVFQADGAAALGYTETTQEPLSRRLYLDVRPALALQFGSPRLAWRAGYLFSGSLTLDGPAPTSYSNQVSLALAAELSERSTIAASASVAQGGTAFQLTQGAPDAGQAGFRAPQNPDLVLATVTESLSWSLLPALRLGQGLLGSASAPQHSLDRISSALTGSVSLDRLFPRDAIGGIFSPGLSVIRPLAQGAPDVKLITNSLVGSWSHDFDQRWNGQATAGVTHVMALTSLHSAVVPTGSLTARHLGDDFAVSLAVTRAVVANLQVGTESISDGITLRGTLSLDRVWERQLGASAGFVRAQPLGDVTPAVASGSGEAVQGDIGLVWAFSDALLATARYSVTRQFGQGVTPSLVYVALIGVTVRYRSAPYVPPMPTAGRRVDGSDAVGFPNGDARKP